MFFIKPAKQRFFFWIRMRIFEWSGCLGDNRQVQKHSRLPDENCIFSIFISSSNFCKWRKKRTKMMMTIYYWTSAGSNRTSKKYPTIDKPILAVVVLKFSKIVDLEREKNNLFRTPSRVGQDTVQGGSGSDFRINLFRSDSSAAPIWIYQAAMTLSMVNQWCAMYHAAYLGNHSNQMSIRVNLSERRTAWISESCSIRKLTIQDS